MLPLLPQVVTPAAHQRHMKSVFTAMHRHQMAFSRALKQFHKSPKIKRDNIANERQLELHSGRAGPGKANHAEGRQTLTITTPGYCLQFCTYFKFRHFDLSRY